MRAVVGDYLTATVEEADVQKTHRKVRFGPGLVSLIVVVILEVIAVVLLFILYVPADSLETSTVIVNASTALNPPGECHTWSDRTIYNGGILVANWAPGDLYITAPISGADFYRSVFNSSCYAPWGEGLVGSYLVYGYADKSFGRMQMECNNSLLPGVKSLMWNGDVVQSSKQIYQHVQEYLSQWSWQRNAVNAAWSVNTTILYNSNSSTAKGTMAITFNFRQAGGTHFGCFVQVTVFCDHGLNAIAELLGLPELSATQVDELNSAGLCGRMAKSNKTCVDTFYNRSFSSFTGPFFFRVQGPIIDCFNMDIYGTPCPEDLDSSDTAYWGDWPDYEGPGGIFGDVDISGAQGFATYIASTEFGDMGYMGNGCPGTTIHNDYFQPGQWPGADGQLKDLVAVYNETKFFTFQCQKLVPPTFMGRVSFVWPLVNVIHTIAMTLIVRYVYKAAVASREMIKKHTGAKSQKDFTDTESGDLALSRSPSQVSRDGWLRLPSRVRLICGLADDALQTRCKDEASLRKSPGAEENAEDIEFASALGPTSSARTRASRPSTEGDEGGSCAV